MLDRYNVGKGEGVADRAIVADAFFSQSEPGVTPKLATMGAPIYNNMLRIKGVRPEKLGKSVFEAFPNGFDVTVNGRTITIVPLPRR